MAFKLGPSRVAIRAERTYDLAFERRDVCTVT